MADGSDKQSGNPALEWIAAAIGLVMTLALLGYVGWQAASDSEEPPPQIVVATGATTPFRGGWVVEVEARNLSSSTASSVEVEGTLRAGGAETKAKTTFGYVPGHSTRRGGLFLPEDPNAGSLEVRASGYADP